MRNIWLPESFQGKNKKRNYFEGWYFKHSAGLAGGVWSFIPGIALGPDGEGYSFVQVIEGRTGRSWWFQYPQDAFSAAEKGLEVRVGDNTFSSRGLHVKLGDASTSIEAELQYGPFSQHSFPFWSLGRAEIFIHYLQRISNTENRVERFGNCLLYEALAKVIG